MTLPKSYDPSSIEEKWFTFWSENDLFKPQSTADQGTFTIVIPPPNVTGILHMGHVLNNTLQDILIRFKRLQGFKTLWIPGTDHAGIATQNKVEQVLAREGKRKEDLGRDAFINKVWEWKNLHGGIIIQQLKRMGCSCDWDRERFTLDTGLSKAVREVFVLLYEKGWIYKGKYIVNQCPRCRTALSDEEVIHKASNGFLWHIHYPLPDGNSGIVVATTRPETMLGDVAVAVHPSDERYRYLIGQHVLLPLQNRLIPVIADNMVDPSFGTGAVKITPAHDANDFEAGVRFNLDPILIMNDQGIMNHNAGSIYEGLDRFECRDRVLDDLKKATLLVKTEPYQNALGHCYRCDCVVEPYLSTQWFVRMSELAAPAIQVVNDGRVTFTPERWTKVYLNWMENIRDWCISRQLWWGHRIPVWTCLDCKHYQAFREEPTQCPLCHSSRLIQDPDVLDTWFSSWLWPFSTMNWPDQSEDLATYYPTSTLITGSEILFFWVARMIMAGIEFMHDIPFSKVYLNGTVRDNLGRKMSKSLGNSPDPLEIMAIHGADALRFSMVMVAPRGSDIFYTDDTLNVGKTFLNKIWNASKLILATCPDCNEDFVLPSIDQLKPDDIWILAKLHNLKNEVTDHIEAFRFNEAAIAIHRFAWHEFCDWYLEVSKMALYDKTTPEHKSAVQKILIYCLSSLLQLLHPFAPYITEEIWHHIFPAKPSISISRLVISQFDPSLLGVSDSVDVIHRLITTIRTMRSETGIPPSAQIHVAIASTSQPTLDLIEKSQSVIMHLSKINTLDFGTHPIIPPVRATSVTPDSIAVYLDLEGMVDVPMEIARLVKEIEKTQAELVKVHTKLGNSNFIDRAPAEIVEKTRQIELELDGKLTKLLEAHNLFKGTNVS